tara:strand:+ start:1420 stop:2451 length:1032 start_codon:yes stop_codon:yes gene_type:complete
MTNDDVKTWMDEVRERTDHALRTYLDEKLLEARQISPSSLELVEGIRSLTLRGGKRLRPIVLQAAMRAVGPERDLGDATAVSASLEVLQSYLLIHDDWMDQDDERRGGPAVHAMYRNDHGEHEANALAILAGDLASAYALELILRTPWGEGQNEALGLFIRIQKEVFYGQHLDLTQDPDVARMHDLKTGSYTVRGPLLLGALLGGATEAQTEALLAYGNPLGEAFQLADDLIGTFGDSGHTGKPGDDLTHRKRNGLVAMAEARLEGKAREELSTLMNGRGHADEALVARVASAMVDHGIRSEVEARITELLASSEKALDDSGFDPQGVEILRFVARKLALRTV